MSEQTKSITVLYIDGSIGFGGAPKSLSLTLRGLTNVKPVIVTSVWEEVRDRWYTGLPVYQIGRVSNYYIQNCAKDLLAKILPSSCFKIVTPWILGAMAHAEALLTALTILGTALYHRVDLIHMNTACFPLVGLRIAQLLNLPSIIHFRGFVVGQDDAVRRASHVIAVSNSVAQSITHIKDAVDISTIYDPVDESTFEHIDQWRAGIRKQIGANPADVVVAIFGRVVQWKGQVIFARACIEVMKNNERIRALIVGDQSDGTPDYLDQVKQVVNDSGMAERFVFSGYQPDVERFYAASDIVVHASIEPEPFGMVIPEAMAARRAVIATNVGGPAEIIESGVDGILIPPGNVWQLSEAINVLANSDDKRVLLGVNAYRKVTEKFSIIENAIRVQEVYRKLLRPTITTS